MAKSPSSKSKKSTNMITKKIFGHVEMEKKYGRMTFGRALRAWRECDEYSIRAYAKMLGMAAASLADIETGRRIPSPARAAKIAQKLGHPPETWVALALNDILFREKIGLKVVLTAA